MIEIGIYKHFRSHDSGNDTSDSGRVTLPEMGSAHKEAGGSVTWSVVKQRQVAVASTQEELHSTMHRPTVAAQQWQHGDCQAVGTWTCQKQQKLIRAIESPSNGRGDVGFLVLAILNHDHGD